MKGKLSSFYLSIQKVLQGPKQTEYSLEKKINLKTILFLLVTAIGVITICSKSSIIYPFNDWVDSHCFFTVGKSMLNGKVLYQDIYEQKGPLLYVLHAVTYLISNTTFLGVYLLEILACFLFLYFTYRTLRLYCNQNIIIAIPFLAALIYSSTSFCQGDSAEELCMPMIAYAIWVSLKALKNDNVPSLLECFLIGVTSGCVLWIKFTMLGFYVGWIIVPAFVLIKKHEWKKLLMTILSIIAGVFVATLPFIIYFGMNHAIKDWLESYIYNNIFIYSNSSISENPLFKMARYVLVGLRIAFQNNWQYFALILVGILGSFFTEKPTVFMSYLFQIAFTALTVYMGGRRYPYYALIFSVFAFVGIIYIYNILCLLCRKVKTLKTSKPKILKYICACVVFVFSLTLSFIISPNTYFIGYSKSDLPQYQFKETIDTVKDPTLLNYGFLDGGFYTVCDIVPNCKYFCGLNIPLDELTETQIYYAENGLVDFIITRNEQPDFELYDCVDQCIYSYEENKEDEDTFYLYQLSQLNQ